MKEGTVIFDSENFNIFALGGKAVSYHMKNVHTIALEVTENNIGAISLEFETELYYDNKNEPYLVVEVARVDENGPCSVGIDIKPGNWIIVLWGHLHVWQDREFKSTFSFDGPPTPLMTDEDVKQVAGELNKEAKETYDGMQPGESLAEFVERNKDKTEVGPNLQKVLDRRAQGQTEIMSPVGQIEVVEDQHGVRGELKENPHNTDGVDTP